LINKNLTSKNMCINMSIKQLQCLISFFFNISRK